jgi:hypothetical protein
MSECPRERGEESPPSEAGLTARTAGTTRWWGPWPARRGRSRTRRTARTPRWRRSTRRWRTGRRAPLMHRSAEQHPHTHTHRYQWGASFHRPPGCEAARLETNPPAYLTDVFGLGRNRNDHVVRVGAVAAVVVDAADEVQRHVLCVAHPHVRQSPPIATPKAPRPPGGRTGARAQSGGVSHQRRGWCERGAPVPGCPPTVCV